MAPDESSVRAMDLAGIHVLVVDDYEDTLEVFGAALQQFGANVLKARDARHALTIMKTVRVNVIRAETFSDRYWPASREPQRSTFNRFAS